MLDDAGVDESDTSKPDKSPDVGRQPTRTSKNLETVIEGDSTEFPNAFDLDDEESWVG